MSKENFKIFAKKHPELAKTILDGKISWQKLYELYDIYGENSSVWDDLLDRSTSQNPFKELFSTFRNLDMATVQKGVTNLQKTIGMLQDIGLGSNRQQSQYEPRPLYTYFED